MHTMAAVLPGGLNAVNSNRSSLRPSFPHGLPHQRQTQQRLVSIRAVAAPPAQQALQYNKLGDSDLVISEVMLGTVSFSQP